ncbi:hypothetical protein GGER_06780 [Serratia rubidaea]
MARAGAGFSIADGLHGDAAGDVDGFYVALAGAVGVVKGLLNSLDLCRVGSCSNNVVHNGSGILMLRAYSTHGRAQARSLKDKLKFHAV